jgi:hypothetical protein
MNVLSITVTNSNDPSCQRLKLTKRFEIEDGLEDPTHFIRECVTYVEGFFREIFPKGMTYTVPYTEVNVEEVADPHTDAERLLRQAYASGQLNGTIIGGKLRDYFGVSYDMVEAEPYSDPAAQTVSLGGQPIIGDPYVEQPDVRDSYARENQ